VLRPALSGLELTTGRPTLALWAALTPCRGLSLTETTLTGLTGAVEAPATFSWCLSGGRKRALALPVAEVALLAVALKGRTPALAALTAGIRCTSVKATAAVASLGAAALVGEIGEGSLARPVGDVPGFRAVLGCNAVR
jgi:ABC-type amino acid transport system permease subunit